MTIVEFHPGVRFVCDTGGDLGLIEYGFSGSFPLTPNRWTDAYSLGSEIRVLEAACGRRAA